MAYLCIMKTRSKVIKLEAVSMLDYQMMAARNGYSGSGKMIEAILEYVVKDEEIQNQIFRKMNLKNVENESNSQENENRNYRKMNSTDRKMTSQESEVEVMGGEELNEVFIESLNGGIKNKMLKTYSTKEIKPSESLSVGSGRRSGDGLLPILEMEAYGGIPKVKGGDGYVVEDGTLYVTKGGKTSVVETDARGKVMVLHYGKEIEIDLSVKSAKI